jgi:CDP-diacylglycerol---serine O-phosphatidyltransferase
MNVRKHIPNIITLLNLFCGCIAITFVSKLQYEMAFYFVCLGIFLDFFDGFFARLFKVSSPLGLQLDSLADMVTSGVVPGYVMFQLLSEIQGYADDFSFVPYLGFIITLGACYRLANFNIDTRQTDSFIGLPTPANALFIMGVSLIENDFFKILISDYYFRFLIVITFLSAFIMNAEIPLFSLKIKDFTFKKNALQLFFLLSSILFLLFFRFMGIPLTIVFYVLLSVINNKYVKK